MTLLLNDEQRMLQDAVRGFVADRSPIRRVREVIAAGLPFAAEVWQQLARDLGLAGLAIPAEYGGAAAGQTHLSVALYELGAGLVPSPLLACTLTVGVLLHLGDEAAQRELLPGIASGELIGTVCLVPVAAEDDHLTGELSPVLNGAEADFLVVPAGEALYLVEGNAQGMTRCPLTSVDHTRSLARVVFDGTPARRLQGDAARALEAVRDVANLALASEQCGAMARCISMTTEYAKSRYAFGQPIGAFQGVKHRLADRHTEWELAYAALRDATRCADEDRSGLSAAAAAARVLASDAYMQTAADTIELHGGIGYTWDYDAHLYYKNALSNKVLFGDPETQLERLAQALQL
jgi:alkylation response protein AidB-like acyl-CoA dehydrogenase